MNATASIYIEISTEKFSGPPPVPYTARELAAADQTTRQRPIATTLKRLSTPILARLYSIPNSNSISTSNSSLISTKRARSYIHKAATLAAHRALSPACLPAMPTACLLACLPAGQPPGVGVQPLVAAAADSPSHKIPYTRRNNRGAAHFSSGENLPLGITRSLYIPAMLSIPGILPIGAL